MSGKDPLEGADVGETRNVTETQYLLGIDMEPREFWGSDRQRDVRIADVEVVENSDGDPIDIKVTWEADLTKRLPRNWDRCNEPLTDRQRKKARRSRWLHRALKVISFAVPLAIATFVAHHITQGLSETMTLNGEPVSPPPIAELVPLMALVMGFAAIIAWAIKGGLPPRIRA